MAQICKGVKLPLVHWQHDRSLVVLQPIRRPKDRTSIFYPHPHPPSPNRNTVTLATMPFVDQDSYGKYLSTPYVVVGSAGFPTDFEHSFLSGGKSTKQLAFASKDDDDSRVIMRFGMSLEATNASTSYYIRTLDLQSPAGYQRPCILGIILY